MYMYLAVHSSSVMSSYCQVRLTWDETPVDRVAVTMKKYKSDEVEEMDLKDYLASSSGEEGLLPHSVF